MQMGNEINASKVVFIKIRKPCEKSPDFPGLPVARVGVEPTRCHHRQILSLMRLPIPPSRHTSFIVPERRQKSRPSGFFRYIPVTFNHLVIGPILCHIRKNHYHGHGPAAAKIREKLL